MVLFHSNTAVLSSINEAKIDIHQICMNQHFTIYECLIKIDNHHQSYTTPQIIPQPTVDQIFKQTFAMAQKVFIKNIGLKKKYIPILKDNKIPLLSTKRVITIIINTAFHNPLQPTLTGQIYSAGKLMYSAKMVYTNS